MPENQYYNSLVKYFSVLRQDEFEKIEDADLNGSRYRPTPAEMLDWEDRLMKLNARFEHLSETAELNNEGMRLEKAGDIGRAITIYEKNISIGCPATHSYERLMVLYRKLRKYDDEIRVINRTIEVYTGCNIPVEMKWFDRKKKAELLKSKV